MDYTEAIWALLYSDDGKLTGRTERYERGLLLHMLVLVIVHLPISWHKVKGGPQVEWIGYWVDAARFELGISANRAAWASRWLSDRATEGRVRVGELCECLGRLQFIAGPVEYLRPFLGPLYSWCATGPRYAQPRLPMLLILVMKYLSEELKGSHTMPCERRAYDMGEVFRMDAKAKGDTVVIGGWRTARGTKAKEASCFSVQLTRATAPWAFARGEPFRTIASLELIGTLVGLMVLVPEGEAFRGETSATITLTCGTDNQGNAYLLDRMLTTKYPLAVILMELAHQMRRRRMVLRARWLPRLENEEADALTNADFHHFDPKKRVEVTLDGLGFKVLPLLFQVGEDYVAELERSKLKAKSQKAEGAKRRKMGQSLRERDPW